MNEINPGDRVKFREDGREHVGTVLGFVPASQFVALSTACSTDFMALVKEHRICIPTNGEVIIARDVATYLVSVKENDSCRPRSLHRKCQVELCNPDDERDGVYNV